MKFRWLQAQFFALSPYGVAAALLLTPGLKALLLGMAPAGITPQQQSREGLAALFGQGRLEVARVRIGGQGRQISWLQQAGGNQLICIE